ncbi:hypothetical protein HDU87_003540 [Geranomyces variabilis]|uniref:DUF2855 family protein n=1 Tax=Geranomyces variabilis TaxID=109894 RepID=A0AAD5TL48_9FUNG|nr:hypothetical protein HDU87_003540 [Geranomyces variabilis]
MASSQTNVEMWVEQADISKIAFKKAPIRALDENEILCRIDSFGLSANNVTYAALGKSFRYFEFFPVVGGKGDAAKYGKVPVWGVATITKSRHPSIKTGERIYGYLPLAQYHIIKVSPSGLTPSFFYTLRDHLPEDRKVYNQYFRVTGDPFYDPKKEGEMMLFRPLYWTSFFLSDYLNEKKHFGAKSVVISSASSKTSFCFAWMSKQRGLSTIGLTSQGNVAFVKSLGFYDSVLTYEQLGQIPAQDSLYVDMSGSKSLARKVHDQLGSNLKRAISVGLANTGESRGTFPEGTELFFAPPWMKQRQEELRGTLLQLMIKSWAEAMAKVDDWVKVKRLSGTENVAKTWETMAKGRTPPDIGYVLTLSDSATGQSKL